MIMRFNHTAAFFLGLTMLAPVAGLSLAEAALIGVEAGSATVTSNVYSIDTTTGVQTLIGNFGLGQVQSLALSPSGVLYATQGGSTTQQLVTINPTTGAASIVGPINVSQFMTALSFDLTGTLYGIARPAGSQISSLYTVNPATGASTLVGTTNAQSLQGMDVSPANVLYGYNSAGDAGTRGLRTIDKVTGNSTFIGPLGGSTISLQSIVFDGDGTLWGSTQVGNLYSIDPVTGASTLKFTGLADLRGLAYVAPVPVPAAVWLFGSGLAAMVGFARRKMPGLTA